MYRNSKGGKSTRNQQLIDEWREAHGFPDEWDMKIVAQWAIENNKWTPPPYDPVQVCAREFSRAAREEYYVDPQDRNVRKKHCYILVDANGQRHWQWIDITNAKPAPMEKAFQGRRNSALQDVVQLNTDVKSYNDNNVHEAQLKFDYNFNEDLADMGHSDEYPDAPPED